MIGIDDYQHPRIPTLGIAVNDARAVQSSLLEQGFRQDHVFALLNEDATKRRIEGVLGDDLRQRVGPNDRVLVFFAVTGRRTSFAPARTKATSSPWTAIRRGCSPTPSA